jgi:uncharacterized protein DUF2505
VVSFDARHEFDAPPAAVTAGLTDPEFVGSLELPDLERPEVLQHRVDDNGRFIQARFRFVGHLDPIARRILGNDRITWVQEVRFEASNERGELGVTPDVHPDRMKFAGDYRLTAKNGGTVRTLTGELSIKVPLIAGRAEKAILPGLLRRVDLEAEALRAWLAARA